MRFIYGFSLFIVVLFASVIFAQSPGTSDPQPSSVSRGVGYVLNYLNMAGTKNAGQFAPLSQRERTHIYWETMVNPLGYFKAASSAGLDQWNDKPEEWQQGAEGYGKRFANILGQYSIQRTVTFVLSSGLHEDNRYFNSGKNGFWSRTQYALASGLLARHDDGSRHPSVSQIAGVATGAFVSRLWLPPSQSSTGNAAISFGISMASNIGFGVVKEFLPDIGHALVRKRANRFSKNGHGHP